MIKDVLANVRSLMYHVKLLFTHNKFILLAPIIPIVQLEKLLYSQVQCNGEKKNLFIRNYGQCFFKCKPDTYVSFSFLVASKISW